MPRYHRAIDNELDNASQHMNAKRAQQRDIPVEDIVPKDTTDRDRCESSFMDFCLTYLCTSSFFRDGKLYPDQIVRINEVGRCVLQGDDIAIAAFRGSAKTTEARAAVLWACLYGHSKHVVLFGATAPDAQANLETIKSELQDNEKFRTDFPEICVPIQALGNSSRRAQSQTIDSEHTYIRWETSRIVMPRVPVGSSPKYRAGGSIIQVRSIDGSVRGLNFQGKRPDLFLFDDIETHDSVKSQDRTAEIHRKIENDIGGGESHTKSATKIYICTIQAEGCASDVYTDPKQRPSYHGIRQQYLQVWPEDWEANHENGLWGQYMEMRRDAVFGGPEKAREFYLEHRDEMESGAQVSWVAGYDPRKYESALEKFFAQWADKRDEGLIFIACEYQNDPTMLGDDEETRLTEAKICARGSGLGKMQIPSEAEVVVAHVDVHGLSGYLYYAILAVGGGFKFPRIIDIDTFPAKKTIGETWPNLSVEAGITRALTELQANFDARKWVRDDGLEMIPRVGVDSGSSWATVVYQFCRNRQNWVPTKGDNPKWKDFAAMGPRDAMRGNNWREMPVVMGKYKTRGFIFNANYWKRFVFNRLISAKEEPTSLLFHAHRPESLIRIARHILAEKPDTIIEKSTGNEYEQWTVSAGAQNHWLDTLVGAFMIASVSGIQVNGIKRPRKQQTGPRHRISFAPV